jgi:hypothetical protein
MRWIGFLGPTLPVAPTQAPASSHGITTDALAANVDSLWKICRAGGTAAGGCHVVIQRPGLNPRLHLIT